MVDKIDIINCLLAFLPIRFLLACAPMKLIEKKIQLINWTFHVYRTIPIFPLSSSRNMRINLYLLLLLETCNLEISRIYFVVTFCGNNNKRFFL